ncbi:MAG TPA: O-antigen polymerase [Fibrobacteria bacterium]|nr:O-antigen polymerase [Fibrobacteria bacterium]
MKLPESIFHPQWGITLAAVSACVLIVASKKATGGKMFSPWRMLMLSNVGGIGIYYLGMDSLMSDWAPETWLIWGLALFAYTAGSWASRFVELPRGASAAAEHSPDRDRSILLACSVPYFIAIAGGLATLGTFPVFAKDPELARGAFAFHAPWSGWFMGSCMLIFLFGARVLAKGGKGVWAYHLLFWSVVMLQMLTGIRGPTLFAFFSLAYQWELHRGSVPLFKVATGLLVFLVLFIGIALLRQGDAIQFTKNIPMSTIVAVVVGPPYAYVSNNFWNLDHGVREYLIGLGHPTTYGFSLTQGIWDIFGSGTDLAKSFGFDTSFNESSAKVRSYNTFNFVWPLFKDGGVVLVALFSAAWGFVTELLHRTAVRTPYYAAQILAPYLAFASLFSFFTLYFIIGSYLVFLAIALVIAMASTTVSRFARKT